MFCEEGDIMGDGELNKMELWRASALWILGHWGCDFLASLGRLSRWQ